MNSYCSSLTLVLDNHFPPYIKLLTVISFFQLMLHAVSMVTFLVENGVQGRKKMADCAVPPYKWKKGDTPKIKSWTWANRSTRREGLLVRKCGGLRIWLCKWTMRAATHCFRLKPCWIDICRPIIFYLMNFLGSFIGQHQFWHHLFWDKTQKKKRQRGLLVCSVQCNTR